MCTVASATFSRSAWKNITGRGDAGQVAEQVGVALPRQAGQRERLLVDRRRGDGVDAAGLRASATAATIAS